MPDATVATTSDSSEEEVEADTEGGAGYSLTIFEKLCGQLDECYYIRDTLRVSLQTLCICAGVGSRVQPPPAWQAWTIRVAGTETVGAIVERGERRYSRLFAAAAARGWVVEGLCICSSSGQQPVLGMHSSIGSVACREAQHARHYRRVRLVLSHAALFEAFMLAQHPRCGAASAAHALDGNVLCVLERLFRASYR